MAQYAGIGYWQTEYLPSITSEFDSRYPLKNSYFRGLLMASKWPLKPLIVVRIHATEPMALSNSGSVHVAFNDEGRVRFPLRLLMWLVIFVIVAVIVVSIILVSQK